MVVKSKYTGLILLILTLCLIGVTAFYNISRLDYKSVDAKIVVVDDEISYRDSNVNHYIMLEYEYEGKITEGKLYVSSLDKYKVDDVIKVKINPDNPGEVIDNSFNKYLIPFVVIIMIFDFLYLKGKKR